MVSIKFDKDKLIEKLNEVQKEKAEQFLKNARFVLIQRNPHLKGEIETSYNNLVGKRFPRSNTEAMVMFVEDAYSGNLKN